MVVVVLVITIMERLQALLLQLLIMASNISIFILDFVSPSHTRKSIVISKKGAVAWSQPLHLLVTILQLQHEVSQLEGRLLEVTTNARQLI